MVSFGLLLFAIVYLFCQQKARYENRKQMRITKIGILALKGSSDLRRRIMEVEQVTSQSVNNWIRSNDSRLTKVAIVKMIVETTGLSQDEILEDVSEVVTK